MRTLGWLSTVLALTACSGSVEHRGTVKVDLALEPEIAVSRHLFDRLRIDIYSRADSDASAPRWIDEREYTLGVTGKAGLGVASVADFPLNFVVQSRKPRSVLVRARLYPSKKMQDYCGEPSLGEPRQSTAFCSEDQRQDLPPPPSNGQPVPLFARQGDRTTQLGLSCAGTRPAGAMTGVPIEIAQTGTYRVSVLPPEATELSPGCTDPILFIVKACGDAVPLACNDDSTDGTLASVDVELEAGDSYWALVANKLGTDLDVRLALEPAPPRSVDPENVDAPDFETLPSPARLALTVPPASSAGFCGLGDAGARASAPEDLRLCVGAKDFTPQREPQPLVTLDQLFAIDIDPNDDRLRHCVLSESHFGERASLFDASRCSDDAAVDLSLEPDPCSTDTDEIAETAEMAEMADTNTDATACVRGGLFTLGEAGATALDGEPTTPERVVAVKAFWMDSYEYTIGRLRELDRRAPGILSEVSDQAAQAAPMDATDSTNSADSREPGYCTASATDAMDDTAQDMPLNCVSWALARKICALEKGSLPTAAQWELAASVSFDAENGRSETAYPWGDTPPDCARQVFGRARYPVPGTECPDPAGPVAVTTQISERDPPIFGLAGNVAEWTEDAHLPLSNDCWRSAIRGIHDPLCEPIEGIDQRTVKGGSWASTSTDLRAAARRGVAPDVSDPQIGFRCVYDSPRTKEQAAAAPRSDAGSELSFSP